jgi:cysteine-rich repeat protein
MSTEGIGLEEHGSVVVINSGTDAIAQSVSVSALPRQINITDSAVYVNDSFANVISVLNPTTFAVERTLSVESVDQSILQSGLLYALGGTKRIEVFETYNDYFQCGQLSSSSSSDTTSSSSSSDTSSSESSSSEATSSSDSSVSSEASSSDSASSESSSSSDVSSSDSSSSDSSDTSSSSSDGAVWDYDYTGGNGTTFNCEIYKYPCTFTTSVVDKGSSYSAPYVSYTSAFPLSINSVDFVGSCSQTATSFYDGMRDYYMGCGVGSRNITVTMGYSTSIGSTTVYIHGYDMGDQMDNDASVNINFVAPICGDSDVNFIEACDDGNTNNSDACRNRRT